jgi:Flp pilus assembly protein TadD
MYSGPDKSGYPAATFRRSGAWIALPLVGLALASCGQSNSPSPRIDTSTRLNLAEVAAAGGDTESARTILEAAANSDPDNGELQLHYAQALLDSGRNEEAVKVARQSAERMSRDSKLVLGAAQLELRAGNPALAAATFQELIKRNGGSVAAFNGLGVARVQSADLAGAEAAFRSAIAAAPGDYAARNNLALVLVLQSRAGEAVPMLQSLAAEPGIPGRVKHNLALAYAQQGDTRHAADALSGVLSESAATREATDLASLRTESGTELVQELGPAELMDGKSSGRAYSGAIPPPTYATAQTSTPVAAEALPAAAAAGRTSEPKVVVVHAAPVGSVQSAALAQSAAELVKPFIASPLPPVSRAATPSDGMMQVTSPTPSVSAGRPIPLTSATVASAVPAPPAILPRPIKVAPKQDLANSMPAATTPAPAMAVTEPAGDGSITVRFAAMPSRSDAMAVWKDMAGDVPDLLSGHSPVVVAVADQDAPWTIGTGGFHDAAAAEAFCQELRARAQSCAVGL